MHRVIAQVEEEGRLRGAPDECHGFARERLGEIRGLFDGLRAAHDRVLRVGSGIRIGMASVRETEELVETPFHRVVLRRKTEVPLANETGHVTRLFQPIRDCLLAQRHAHVRLFLRRRAGVVPMAEALLIPAGHQPRARRTAHRARHVAVRETHPTRRNGVDVRCRNVLTASRAQVRVAQVVRENDNDVRPSRGGGTFAKTARRRPRRRAQAQASQKIAPVDSPHDRNGVAGCVFHNSPPSKANVPCVFPLNPSRGGQFQRGRPGSAGVGGKVPPRGVRLVECAHGSRRLLESLCGRASAR